MENDITGILRDWEYDPDNTVRIVKADDGRELMQVRLPLGMEQYELDGRPDGARIFGKSCVLDEYLERLERTEDGEFSLEKDDFLILRNEGILYYSRYLLLFQVGDYERVARDTGHNLMICDLVENYFDSDEDRNSILQYKPYILRMNVLSKAMIALQEGENEEAQAMIENAVETIERMTIADTPVFQFERVRSIEMLSSALEQVKEKKADPIDKLNAELASAIENEEYERAAEIRDEIHRMTKLGAEMPVTDEGHGTSNE